MVVKRKIEVSKQGIHPSEKVLVDLMKNMDTMAGKTGSDARIKKGHDITLSPRPARRIAVKGKIAHVRRVTPKLRLD